MSKKSDAYFKDIPMKPYDLLKEGLIVLSIITVIVIILAAVFSSPDYPTVRGEDVAKRQPIAYLRTSANTLGGFSGIQTYGPPYTKNYDNAQRVFGIAPANLPGVTIPINAEVDFVLKPLERVAVLNKGVDSALKTYKSATPAQQQVWLKNYLIALDKATVVNGEVRVPGGNFGPVATMMNGMLNLGKAGLLEGALESNPRLPYSLNPTRSLLFFQDDVYVSVADSLDMLSGQWGLVHETGNYPGAWWLWPYVFFYQISPFNTSPNADLQVGLIMLALFLILIFLPVIPVLNRIPRGLGIYRIIWRDWYARSREIHEFEPRRKAG